jgi:hypothetical protein
LAVHRDSLFSEVILWSGGPSTVIVPSYQRALSWALGVVSAVCTLLAIAVSRSALQGAGGLVLFAAWCASFGIAVRLVPVVWSQATRLVVTDRHVIWTRGRLKRTMERAGISYALIRWNPRDPNTGDLELVRAVPTGALRRTLSIVMRGLTAPDRVWSIVRGVPATAAGGNGERPLAQRLDPDETVVWSGQPLLSWRSWMPLSTRRTLTAALGLACALGAVQAASNAGQVVHLLRAAGLRASSVTFLTVTAALVLTIALLVACAGVLAYAGIARKPRLDSTTRYLVTDRRVLIRRGREEIHLDRDNIVDVVDHEGAYGGRDVYFVMDGPHSRAVAASGAFGPGEHATGFLPVLRGVTDVEGLRGAFSRGKARAGARVSCWSVRPKAA